MRLRFSQFVPLEG